MYDQLTDTVLLELLKKSDEKAFAEIYQRYWERLSLQTLKVTHSREDAKDIVQEVFVSFWKRRMEIDVKESLQAYLLKSVRNGAIRYIERNITRNRYLQTLSDSFAEDYSSPDSQFEFKEFKNCLDQAIASLPSKMQEVYLLSRNERMSYKEIANHLGVAENTVRKQVSNALKLLRASANESMILLLVIFSA